MLPYITAGIFFVALAAVFTPEHFNVFSACFCAILIIQICIIKPTRNQLSVFIILASVFIIEYAILVAFRPLPTVSSYLLLQLVALASCYVALIYKHEIFGGWITRDVQVRLAEGVLLKYLKYGAYLELLALLEDCFRVYLDVNVRIIYDNYPWLKVVFATGLFVLLFELFKTKEEPKRLFF